MRKGVYWWSVYVLEERSEKEGVSRWRGSVLVKCSLFLVEMQLKAGVGQAWWTRGVGLKSSGSMVGIMRVLCFQAACRDYSSTD